MFEQFEDCLIMQLREECKMTLKKLASCDIKIYLKKLA